MHWTGKNPGTIGSGDVIKCPKMVHSKPEKAFPRLVLIFTLALALEGCATKPKLPSLIESQNAPIAVGQRMLGTIPCKPELPTYELVVEPVCFIATLDSDLVNRLCGDNRLTIPLDQYSPEEWRKRSINYNQDASDKQAAAISPDELFKKRRSCEG